LQERAQARGNVHVIANNGRSVAEEAYAEDHYQKFQSEHGVSLSGLFLARLPLRDRQAAADVIQKISVVC
jgi:hypothetical protein